MNQPHRLAADAAHQFGGTELDRTKPLEFRLDGRRIAGFAGDTVLAAVLAAGIDSYGRLGELPVALTENFAPLASRKGGTPLPIARLAAADGLDLTTVGQRRIGLGGSSSLGHRIDGIPEAPWRRDKPTSTLTADLLVIGGGGAGLAAADAAASAGRSVILIERRLWLGGDARYFGPVGEESPEAILAQLIEKLRAAANFTLLTQAEAFAINGTSALVHRIEGTEGRVIAIDASRIVLATGSQQRLPVFAGNRLPGVSSSIGAYHLAKRYGVAHGKSALVATQSNFGYRLAHRLHDAGIAIRRIVDTRVNAQSRFVDFSKATGLNLAGGQLPVIATPARHGLQIGFANIGAPAVALTLEAEQLIVSGPFQPDLSLWMLAGGSSQWLEGELKGGGAVEHVALAGSAAGFRSLFACLESGRIAQARLFGGPDAPIADVEIGAQFETPDDATPIAPLVPGAPAFFDSGPSLIARPVVDARPVLTSHAHAPSLGDVAASVELGLIAPADAGAVAEERGAPGGDLDASDWRPAPTPATEMPAWLNGRFGDDPVRLHLVVDGKRKFERGALVYANISPPDPTLAIGVIVAAAEGQAGGIALVSSVALKTVDRFIVETLDGPSPARIAAG